LEAFPDRFFFFFLGKALSFFLTQFPSAALDFCKTLTFLVDIPDKNVVDLEGRPLSPF